MPKHVVVDGSNIATEGRERPSLRQLNEAVMAFMSEHPEALITVVVDATFGHRIDPKEVAEFDEAVSNNELVAPPAGAIGRGDGFVLSIANKVSAVILTNDSYQEFHAEYPWLFDEGRLIGGKPVPHIGWVFVKRLPVRGPTSRKVTAEAKRKGRPADQAKGGDASVAPKSVEPTKQRGKQAPQRAPKASIEANLPMPVPTAPPPGALPPKSSSVNELLPFLSFVEAHPVGSTVEAVVDHYSSHGAYVRLGDVMGYVALRLMADPAPRSAREFMKVGDTVTLVVERFIADKRSVDLAVPGMATATPPPATKKAARRKKADAVTEPVAPSVEPTATEAPTEPAGKRPRKAAKKAGEPLPVQAPDVATHTAADAQPATGGRTAPKKAGVKKAAASGASNAAVAKPTAPVKPAPDAAAPKVTAKKATKPAPKPPVAASDKGVPAQPAAKKQARPKKGAATAPESAPAPWAAPTEVAPAPRRGRAKA
jgi:hypothetical protein